MESMMPISERSKEELYSFCCAVAALYGCKVDQLLSSSRKQNIVNARSVCMYLMYHHTSMSNEDVALWFNKGDHTSTIFARNKVELAMSKEEKFAALIEKLRLEHFPSSAS